jgi:tetratricopeptide (TPR) repeat protein
MKHLDEDVLAEYALLPDGPREDPKAAAHLAECAECTVRLNGLRTFLDALASPASWELAGVFDTGHGSDEDLFAFAAQAQQEYDDAAEALAPLLMNAVVFVRERVYRKPELRTLGAVRVLAEAANAACEREPIHARNLADAAVTIADALSAGRYPLDSIRALRGLAWKERANALRYLAEYDLALEALDHAGKELAHFGSRTYESATLSYIRSVILTYTDRLSEAAQQAALSAAIFTEYGDADSAMRARSVQAGVLYYRRDYRGAVEIFEELLAYAEGKRDRVETARQAYNAGACWIELGEGARAESLLNGARETYRLLGRRTEVAAADWKLGVIPRLAGDLKESVDRLRAAKAACEQLGMADEAANVTLDLMESLLLLGRSSEISSLCSEVMRYYKRAGKVHQALTAAAFLKEAASAGTIRPETVNHVRRFVEELDRRPELVFVPLIFVPPRD